MPTLNNLQLWGKKSKVSQMQRRSLENVVAITQVVFTVPTKEMILSHK